MVSLNYIQIKVLEHQMYAISVKIQFRLVYRAKQQHLQHNSHDGNTVQAASYSNNSTDNTLINNNTQQQSQHNSNDDDHDEEHRSDADIRSTTPQQQ